MRRHACTVYCLAFIVSRTDGFNRLLLFCFGFFSGQKLRLFYGVKCHNKSNLTAVKSMSSLKSSPGGLTVNLTPFQA